MAEIIKTVDESLAQFYIFGAVSADAPNVLQKNFRTPGGTEYVGRGESSFPVRNIFAMLVKHCDRDTRIHILTSHKNSKCEEYFKFEVLFKRDDIVGEIRRFVPENLLHEDISNVVALSSSGWKTGMVVIFSEDKELLNNRFEAYYADWRERRSKENIRDLALAEIFKKNVVPEISADDYDLRSLNRALNEMAK